MKQKKKIVWFVALLALIGFELALIGFELGLNWLCFSTPPAGQNIRNYLSYL